ncbi:MAG TPA: polysaccharide ABC transporter ATP-binding protein, partial [Caulobacteraceae bacterium]|nr:polysaccharide ABC transporter ATP-binding protein [Caulobacteraceae bacterium]
MGVIGRNGAGKSTLLKILSRITEPTEGRAVIRGRMASLLEVGAGFHPELTGRENIYLNGAILGLTRAEIAARFDEIVAFAEVERFLDTPVKRYSSGMYVRLAFAVAAHLEPEILIIDEVLAVGDVAFQRKCLGKMQDVARGGRTVIFVSHNLPSVVDLSDRAMLLNRGGVATIGPSHEVVSQYLGAMRSELAAGDISAYRRPYRQEGWVDIVAVRVGGCPLGATIAEPGAPIRIEIDLTVRRAIEHGLVVVNVLDERLDVLATFMSSDAGALFALQPGDHRIACEFEALPLAPGAYQLNVGVAPSGGKLAWDVVNGLPGFRMGGEENPAWLRWPERPGALFQPASRWQADGH